MLGTSEVLILTVAVITAVVSIVDRWHRWMTDKDKHKVHFVLISLYVLSLVATFFLVTASAKQRETEKARSEKAFNDKAYQLARQFSEQKQDLEARLVASDQRTRLTAEDCIKDSNVRKQAQEISPRLSRSPNVALHIGTEVSVKKN